jgi:hypothetical protein
VNGDENEIPSCRESVRAALFEARTVLLRH